jgi:hypothetical protein
MGRQKTLWIDEACWKKLELMVGTSTSEKVRVCIKSHDLATQAQIDALRQQIAILKHELIKRKIDGWWMD